MPARRAIATKTTWRMRLLIFMMKEVSSLKVAGEERKFVKMIQELDRVGRGVKGRGGSSKSR